MTAQAGRLVELGVHELAGISAAQLRAYADALTADAGGTAESAPTADGGDGDPVLVVHPSLVPVARLAPLLRREGREGFVVVDMSDLADFTPTDDVEVPDSPLYLLRDVRRGDDLRDWTPTDARAELGRRGRTPVTIGEGVSWLLQRPELLEPGACFMCVGSRKRKAGGGLDARTPAVWISGGTGRDGRERKGAPKVGWCWAGNHHTWLGFASTSGRVGARPPLSRGGRGPA